MYEKVEKSKENKSKTATNSVTQKKSSEKQGIELVDNRSKTVTQRKEQNLKHSKGCGCANCTSTIQQPLQKKRITSSTKALQLKDCSECGKSKGHLSGCSRHRHNRSSTGKGTHKLGGSHDDGSGYQKGGSGGDRHEKGRRAAQKARDRK